MAKKKTISPNGKSLFGAEEFAVSTYTPLPSVWSGDDAELLEKMLSFYPKKPPVDILDARRRFFFAVASMPDVLSIDFGSVPRIGSPEERAEK